MMLTGLKSSLAFFCFFMFRCSVSMFKNTGKFTFFKTIIEISEYVIGKEISNQQLLGILSYSNTLEKKVPNSRHN